MNEGIRILIERMESNPEDFAPMFHHDAYIVPRGGATWRSLAEVVTEDKTLFTEEEKFAVTVALREASRTNFTAKVLEVMTSPPAVKYNYQSEEYNKGVIGASTAQAHLTGVNANEYQRALYQQQALMNKAGNFATNAVTSEG